MMQRCSEKAFAMCPTNYLCGTREEATFADFSECAAFNKAVNDQPITNADRIRAMSDEELANFINHFNVCDTRTNDECKISYCAVCEVCVLDWLREPVKEERAT